MTLLLSDGSQKNDNTPLCLGVQRFDLRRAPDLFREGLTSTIAHMSADLSMAGETTFTVLDFETTGSVAGWPVEPWQLGIACVQNGRVEPAQCRELLLRVDPDRPFNPRAPGRHARIRKELAQANPLSAHWPALAPLLVGGPLVAHNVGTERGVLERAAPLHRFGPWIDTLRLTRRSYPELASAALEDVVLALDLKGRLSSLAPGRAPHDAQYDALACAVLLEHFLSLPGWRDVTVQALTDCR